MSVQSDYFYDSADGLRLYCARYPAAHAGGVPVLCLPGLTRNSRDFSALAAHLSERNPVLAADLRGRGRSAWDPQPARYQLLTYVPDAWSLLDSLGIERVILIGTSLGAMMSMVMAATKPERIAGAVLNDVGPELDPAGVRRIASYAGKLPPVTSWAEAAAQAKSIYGLALPGLTDAQWLEYARRGYRENDSGVPIPDVDPKIAEALSPAVVTLDLWALFAQIKNVPLLVIRGATSDILSAATVERMQREQPTLIAITVANRGHTPLLDEPECLAAIDAFLLQHGRSSGPAAAGERSV